MAGFLTIGLAIPDGFGGSSLALGLGYLAVVIVHAWLYFRVNRNIYPRHKAFLDQFIARGEVVGVGPFTDPTGGNMALFRSRDAAEAFAKSDPFFLEGVVKEYQIKDWGDKMLS